MPYTVLAGLEKTMRPLRGESVRHLLQLVGLLHLIARGRPQASGNALVELLHQTNRQDLQIVLR